jgi:TRAP-type C4-dicarboxylate transport system substrate-binding protein
MPSPRLSNAIAHGAIDGAVLSPTGLFQFGVSQVAKNHFLLGVGAAPLILVMSRQKFDRLPEEAKAVIRKFSGEWAATTWIRSFGAGESRFLDKLRSDSDHKVVTPSSSDLQTAQQIYQSMTAAWADKSARNRELLKAVKAELATIRSTQ